ncbi:beta-ketoacyl synthase N-terminal-like domain-containing protein, partial [Roseiarcus sp.]|uniref:beta-ketoacyl synthase N-terminal-like domain-containing protein n=1 Tax=Roseiarcus sp. TaxID=1969460 RepID=UPI003F96BF55
CRLPGAQSIDTLWELLEAGRCAVSAIPADRWALLRHGHPRLREPGRSYTWAAGVLPDPWGFDPAVFRISPREAQQMDPQQRLLLELAFEACEDSGLAPSKLAGSQTGVYVGASALDYSTIGLHDPAVADAYYATGNTLSIVSNRLSYVFDLHGPSMTIDTACSSSLVALHQARLALIHGEIDAALVGGVNVLASPFSFISFSQATMLSPTGLCRAFAAEADGYVRAEGGVVLVLKTLKKAIADGDRIHAVLCGSGVNSDGRTSGISLPAEKRQIELLRAVYSQAEVAPDLVAFVEAHGTGTRVGDPVEASALGAVLGRARSRPLPIGSIKTNIGHTEPASGLAGLLKAMLALEHDMAPRSLHAENLNPNIDFAGLNLHVVGEPIPLSRAEGRRFAGVSSFGFGGTSAHVVIGDPPLARTTGEAAPRLMMISAQTEEALRALAGAYAGRFEDASVGERLRIVAATGRRRERMRERLALPALPTDGLAPALARFARSGEAEPPGARATAVEGDGAIVFVFSGNGSQWSGMGRAAYRTSAAFREALAEVDSHFLPLAGWSLVEELDSPDIAADLSHADIAQPMIFAIQAASVRALAEVGVRPALTLGHSVGEVAAAEAAGVLSLADAVQVIFHRSRLQQATENSGGMAVVFGPREAAADLSARIPGLAVAAHNSHRCIVVAGPSLALDRLIDLAPPAKLRARKLDLPYPFHTELMQPVKKPLIERLAGLKPSAGAVPFLSTVADAVLPGAAAGASYWWRNVRDVVLFQEGVERALGMGKRAFLEIGPRPTLKIHLRDIVEHLDAAALIDCALEENAADDDGDPFEATAMRLIAGGADVGPQWAFGPDPGPGIDLPAYPWRRAHYRFAETTESTGQLSARPRHPLIGARDSEGALEWRATLDPQQEPALADHRIDGQVLLPGAAFLEMGLSVARDWAGPEVALRDFEILQPLAFAAEASREILCRVEASTAAVEILSRPRLANAPYATHARGRIVHKPGPPPTGRVAPTASDEGVTGEALYASARAFGLEFGPAFRRLARARRAGEDRIEVELAAAAADPRYGLDPARLDSCFHGLILLFAGREGEGGVYLPVRFGEARLFVPGANLACAAIRTTRRDDRVIVADFDLFDRDSRLVATLRDARYQAGRTRAPARLSGLGFAAHWIPATAEFARRAPLEGWRNIVAREPQFPAELGGAALLLEGWATAACFKLAHGLARDDVLDLDELVAEGRLPEARGAWAETVFSSLEQSGLIRRSGDILRPSDLELPSPDAVFSALAAQHPERAPELLLAAGAAETLQALAAGQDARGPSDGAVEACELRSPSATAAARALGRRLEKMAPAEGDGTALRILQVGVGPAGSELIRFAAARSARLTLLDLDARRLERARLSHGDVREAAFCGDLDALPDGGFDLIVSAGGLSRLSAGRDALARLACKCAFGAVLMAVEPTPSLFHVVAFGLADTPKDELRDRRLGPSAWSSECARAGFRKPEARLIETGEDLATLIVAEAPEVARAPDPQ